MSDVTPVDEAHPLHEKNGIYICASGGEAPAPGWEWADVRCRSCALLFIAVYLDDPEHAGWLVDTEDGPLRRSSIVNELRAMAEYHDLPIASRLSRRTRAYGR